jgi:hypothetical protein
MSKREREFVFLKKNLSFGSRLKLQHTINNISNIIIMVYIYLHAYLF